MPSRRVPAVPQPAGRRRHKVVAVGRGNDVRQDALDLGAHAYIDAGQEDAAAELQAMGGAQAIVATVGKADVVANMMGALAPQGRLVVLAAGKDRLAVSTGLLVRDERSVVGSLTGSPYENERALDFSVLVGARPRIETMPLEQASEAYRRMKSGDVRFRMVLTMTGAGLAGAGRRP